MQTYSSEKLVAPQEILGTEIKPGGYTKTVPKSWSREEVAWAMERRSEGYSDSDISQALGRSQVSVQIKLKREGKSNQTYNSGFRKLKYAANASFLNYMQARTVLDAFAGESWWKSQANKVVTNDIDMEMDTDYHLPAFDLMCDLYRKGSSFDIIDLDPFGSAYECFDFAVRLAKKGVVVSFGEWGHKRWRRTDFVSSRYGITSVEDFSEEKFISEFQRIARTHKKEAIVFDSLQYKNFFRVYFELQPFKQLSQWQ